MMISEIDDFLEQISCFITTYLWLEFSCSKEPQMLGLLCGLMYIVKMLPIICRLLEMFLRIFERKFLTI